MATTDLLQLIDTSGVVAVDLLRGPVRLRQDSWSPRLARLRESELGNQSVYEEVDEELTLDIVATSGDDPGATLAAIQRLCMTGRRWALGDPAIGGYPPRLRVRPAGTRLASPTVNYYEATITGGGLDGQGDSYTRMLEAHAVGALRLTVRRTGGWRISTGSTVTDGPRAPQTIHQITFGSTRNEWSPASLAITPSGVVNPAGDPGITGVVLVSPALTGSLTIYDWTLAAPAGTLSNVAATHARGGSHVRWAPTGATSVLLNSDPVAITPFLSATPYLTLKVASGGPFQVRLAFTSSVFDEPGAVLYTEWATVRGAEAQVIAFQTVSSGQAHDRTHLELKSLAAGTLDLDSLVLQQDGMVGVHAIRLAEGAFLVGTSAPTKYNVMTIWHNPSQSGIAFPAPTVGQYPSATPFSPSVAGIIADRVMGYLGDAAIHVYGSGVYILPLLVWDTNFVPMVGGSQCNLTVEVRRHDMSVALG